MKNLHPLQISILQKLMYSNGLKFSGLKPAKVGGGKFSFHLERLIREGWMEKNGVIYSLTAKGKELAGRMDLGDKILKSQAKISVVMVCLDTKGLEDKYLLYTRLKSPFYKFQGFPTGKVQEGEMILEAARRELKEETNLKGEPDIIGVLHSLILDSRKALLEDKVFFVCKFINPKGLLKNGPEGKYKWVNQAKINHYLKNPVQEIADIFKILSQKEITFLEKSYIVHGF
jgi:8-oxo-dGTP pyrophosphatase MutT (NUDIX family)